MKKIEQICRGRGTVFVLGKQTVNDFFENENFGPIYLVNSKFLGKQLLPRFRGHCRYEIILFLYQQWPLHVCLNKILNFALPGYKNCTLDLIHRIYFSNYSITSIFSLVEDSEDTKYINKAKPPPPTINGKITGNINIISQTMPGKQKSEPLRHSNTPNSFYKHHL